MRVRRPISTLFPYTTLFRSLTVAATQDVAAFLRDRGHDVRAYSGQTEQAERLAAEDDLLNNRVKALVATSALGMGDRKSTRLNSSHVAISYAVFCLKKKNRT